ncbi:sigma-70 family RNA polymerase sigma factor [Microbacterium testaceum]|uniref:sigma-70 family RNA polymerase sigma factor n=1 Tax=Microbacterium testaceum TaxID=2033 RepID=UPI0015E174B3|nr:sigma-70 family RNA polymerase sigma factor [Microbacterium testaceum]
MSSSVTAPSEPASPMSPERLARENLPLAKYLAVEKARSAQHVDLDDLLSAAYLGLATASMEYEPERGIPFGAYARTKITWAILNEMRSADPAGERSREKIERVRVADEIVRARTGRAASVPELAAESGLDAEVVVKMQVLDEMVRTGTSFEVQFEGDDSRQPVDLTDSVMLPEHAVEQAEKQRMLDRIIGALPDQMRRVIRGVYLDERMVKDVAADLEVSHAYVSKLRRVGLTLMREALDAWENGTVPDRSTATKAAFFDGVFGPVAVPSGRGARDAVSSSVDLTGLALLA